MSRGKEPWIAREGWPVIGIMAAAAALLTAGAWILGPLWALLVGGGGLLLVVWGVWFFRDPDRRTPVDAGAFVCGADGVVCFVGPGSPPRELGLAEGDRGEGMMRVSIFMNVFDVHVNRAPAACLVERIAYRPGKFFNASLDKASEHNERMSLLLRLEDGRAAAVVQIAGLVARRIVCRVKEGERLAAGERFGLIRFGSRVDHYLPAGSVVMVEVGQRVHAGETIIGRAAMREASSASVHAPSGTEALRA